MKKNNSESKHVRHTSRSMNALGADGTKSQADNIWALSILDGLSDGVVLVDASGIIRYTNSRLQALFGWDQGELIGRSIDTLLPPRFRRGHILHWENYMQQPVQKPMGIGRELLGYRKDKTEFPIEVSLSPFETDTGHQILCLISDISGRLDAVNKHGVTGKRFETLFKAFPLPSYIWQRKENDFILINYNEVAQHYGNTDKQMLLGIRLSTLYPEGGQDVASIESCYQDRISFTREFRDDRSPNGGDQKDQLVTFVFGEPDLVMVIIEDQTEKLASLSELNKLSSAVEQTADAVFITDNNGIIEYVNPGFEAITGYTRAEALGQTPRILKSGQMSTDYYQKLWHTILAGEVFRAQTTNRKQNGTLFIAEQTITPMKDREGNVTHLVSVLKDMTERIRLNEQETEHRLAGLVQNRLFPARSPNIPGYDIAGAFFPTQATSGDYFDYIEMLEDTFGIVVADVSGHGMSSALLMSESRAFLRSIIQYESEPRKILTKLNIQILPDLFDDSNFITTLIARLHPESHILEYANAGNWPAYVFNRQGKVIRELRAGGPPIGAVSDLNLRPAEPISLAPGCLIAFLTDGIPEASDSAFQEFGVQRLLAVIRRHRSEPAREIIIRVREAVQDYMSSAPQADDHTIIICKRLE